MVDLAMNLLIANDWRNSFDTGTQYGRFFIINLWQKSNIKRICDVIYYIFLYRLMSLLVRKRLEKCCLWRVFLYWCKTSLNIEKHINTIEAFALCVCTGPGTGAARDSTLLLDSKFSWTIWWCHYKIKTKIM